MSNTDGESAWPPRNGAYNGESYSDKNGSWSWNEQYSRWDGVNGSKNVMLIEPGTEVCCNLENTKVMTYTDALVENFKVPMSVLDGPIKMMGGAGDVFGIWELLGIALGASDSNAKYAILPLMVVKGQGDDALKMLNAERGAFSVADWSKYPSAIPKPAGPFRLLEGAEYDAARKAANQANQAMRRSNPEAYKGLEIHEIHPVKYGGSPTDPANKIAIPRDYHRKEVTPWWNNNLRSTK